MTRSQSRRAALPEIYTARIEAALKKRGYTLEKPKALAEAVLKLSDFYLDNPSSPTPWSETWAQVASLVYFFPLNYSRSELVARECRRLGFFEGLSSVVDDGAGMGSALHAFRDLAAVDTATWRARDVAPESLQLLNELAGDNKVATDIVGGINRQQIDPVAMKSRLVLASYVFTELPLIPPEWLKAEALILIEPSIREDARRLQAQRKTLHDAGFEIWAPCPHQGDCPLLIHSDKDWCHDRVHFDAPAWYLEIEKLLPIKNRTLTFTYLAARKKPAPVRAENHFARLVGDTLDEKGKTRQALCRGPEKEFLAWFPQRMEKAFKAVRSNPDEKFKSLELERGSLVRLKTEALELRSNEVRLADPADIYEFGTDESPTQ